MTSKYRLDVQISELDSNKITNSKRFGVIFHEKTKLNLEDLACIIQSDKQGDDISIHLTDAKPVHATPTTHDSTVSKSKQIKTWADIKFYGFRPYTQLRNKQERWLLQFRGHIYVIEGNIGSGKSTLGKLLTEYLNDHKIPCVFLPERFPQQTLEKFIEFSHDHPNEPNPFAFELQKDILKLRLETYQLALEWSHKGYVVFIDRSLPGDYVFGLTNYMLGNMTEEQWVEYTAMLAQVDLLEPTAIIFLDASVPSCIKRKDKRARNSEDKYDPNYLQRIEDTYKYVFAQLTYPIITIPWSEDRQVEDVMVCKILATSIFKGLEGLLHADCDSNQIRIIV